MYDKLERVTELTKTAAYTTGVGTAVGALSVNEWAAVVGAICAVGTFAVNWYYKRLEAARKGRANV